MEGPAFVKWIETMLIQNDISKETFYSESGISTANMHNGGTESTIRQKNPSKKQNAFLMDGKKKRQPARNGLMAYCLARLWLLTGSEADRIDAARQLDFLAPDAAPVCPSRSVALRS